MVSSELKTKDSLVPVVTLLACVMLAACGGGDDYESLDDEGYCPVPVAAPNTPVIEELENDSSQEKRQYQY